MLNHLCIKRSNDLIIENLWYQRASIHRYLPQFSASQACRMQSEPCLPSFRLGEKTPGVVRRCFEALSYRCEQQFLASPRMLHTSPPVFMNSSRLTIAFPCREAPEQDDEHWNIHWRVGNFKTGDWERCLPHQRINHFPKAW